MTGTQKQSIHLTYACYYFIFGALFGAGLSISGMTDQNKVLDFLDLFGQWDPTLMFVMGGGVGITMIGYRFILKRPMPLWGNRFMLPISTVIDKNLVLGSILFGIGWGLYGYCPGPAIASLAHLHWETFLFAGAMVLGMFLRSKQEG